MATKIELSPGTQAVTQEGVIQSRTLGKWPPMSLTISPSPLPTMVEDHPRWDELGDLSTWAGPATLGV